MPALRWSLDINPCKAGKPDAATGQYRIWKDPGQHFRVMHRSAAAKPERRPSGKTSARPTPSTARRRSHRHTLSQRRSGNLSPKCASFGAAL